MSASEAKHEETLKEDVVKKETTLLSIKSLQPIEIPENARVIELFAFKYENQKIYRLAFESDVFSYEITICSLAIYTENLFGTKSKINY